jgi:hypothetical protein
MSLYWKLTLNELLIILYQKIGKLGGPPVPSGSQKSKLIACFLCSVVNQQYHAILVDRWHPTISSSVVNQQELAIFGW